MLIASRTLEDQLPEIKSWAVIGPQFFITTENQSGTEDTEMLTTAEVAVVHPDLPDAIRGLISHNKKFGTSNYAPGDTVCSNLRILRGDVMSFVGKLGQVKLIDFPVEFSRHSDGNDSMKMYAVSFIIGTVNKGDRKIPYISFSRLENSYAPIAGLDSAYPGWQQRWEIGREVGVPHTELMRHVFTNARAIEPVGNAALPSFE